MYKLIIRPLLFLFSPETAHLITLKFLKISRHIPLCRTFIKWCFAPKIKGLEKEVFGLTFKNPVGLAGGLDKNADMADDMAYFGFSFVEVGSLTPKPQNGNPAPRCFRLPRDKAIINRMGINNKGVSYAASMLKNRKHKVLVAANITKNATTPNDKAYKDFEKSFAILYDFVDFFVLNISCPNVENLTELQDIKVLTEIIEHINTVRRFNDDHRPVLLKVSPDIPFEQIDEIINVLLQSGIEGIVATNTTRRRDNLQTASKTVDAMGNGGLSGAPLFDRSLEFVKHIHEKTQGILPIIACGGIMTPQQALKMLDAGASLIEIYTGFIYNGPAFIKQINKYIAKEYAARRIL